MTFVPICPEIDTGMGTPRVASEHLASVRFAHRLHRLIELGRAADGAPVAISACFPDEEHEIDALVVAFHAGRAGYRILYLGARLPFEDLERACDVVQPDRVFLSITRDALYQAHRPRFLNLLRRLAGRHAFHLGGAGCPATDPDVERAGGRIWPAARPIAELAAALAGRGAGGGRAGSRGSARGLPPGSRRRPGA